MFVAGVICFFIGMGVLYYYRSTSRQNFFFRRAPQLKISEFHTFDDVWITGMIEAPTVVIPPLFAYESVSYTYSLYEKKVRYERDSNGKERRIEFWDLVYSKADSTSFLINDGSGQVLVNPEQAIQKYFPSDIYQTTWWKHTITYLPASGLISSVGIVSEDKKQLIPKGETPLMITPMGRKNFIQSLNTEEKVAKYSGLSLTWLSFTFVAMEGFEQLRWLNQDGIAKFIFSGILGAIPFAGTYYYFTFNSFVNLRRKVINSWANVDVELKARRDLIPNLVTSLEGYLKYEKDSFSAISQLREKLASERRLANRIEIENEISKHIAKINLTIESYPELNSGPVILISENLKVIENKIAHSKSHFNTVVEEYNNLIEGFPSKHIAGKHQFTSVPFYGTFKAEELKVENMGSSKKRVMDTESLKALPPEIAAAMSTKQDEPLKKAA
ncbi:MAG: LemA family protein [Bdellovibrionaceae bacterium]|nr:LemA family protein [Pseudobdellovibrionaceae bacterium]